MIRTATENTRHNLIHVLDAHRTTCHQLVDMWVGELEDEPDLFDTQVVTITARIERLTNEAKLRTRQIDALEIWTSVSVDNRDIDAIQALIDQYREQRESAVRRSLVKYRSVWEHDHRKGAEAADRAAALTKYIDLLQGLLS